MAALSTQIRSIVDGGDDGWGILYSARQIQAEGKEVLILAVGDHDFPTAEPIVTACTNALNAGRHGYGSIAGIPPLRDLIAKRASAAHGIDVAPDEVIISMGGQAALFAASYATMDNDAEAIVIQPYYATYAQTIRAVGGTAVIVQTSADNHFQPEIETLRAAITPKTKAILTNSPNNPSGVVYTRETLEGIAELCREHDLWLISDEVYHSQVYETDHISPASLPGMRERTFIIDSMSKSHAMTGWRAGWLICPTSDAALKVADVFLTSAYGVAPFIQLAMRAALAIGVEPEHEISQRYRLRRDIAVKALQASKKLRVVNPDAAMYVLVDIRGMTHDCEGFAEALLQATNVAVMPGKSFGEATMGHIRISLTAPDTILEDACTRIASFADQWNQV